MSVLVITFGSTQSFLLLDTIEIRSIELYLSQQILGQRTSTHYYEIFGDIFIYSKRNKPAKNHFCDCHCQTIRSLAGN